VIYFGSDWSIGELKRNF